MCVAWRKGLVVVADDIEEVEDGDETEDAEEGGIVAGDVYSAGAVCAPLKARQRTTATEESN